MFFQRCTLLLTLGLLFLGCGNQKQQKDEGSTYEQVHKVISDFKALANKYEKPANDAVKLVIESMGETPEELKTKDLPYLKGHAKQAEGACLEAVAAFKEFREKLPESLPDSVKYPMVTVSTLLHDAYLGRADAMLSAERLFSDSLEYHLEDISLKLKAAIQLSDHAAFGFMTIEKMVQLRYY